MIATVVYRGERWAVDTIPLCQVDFCDNCSECLDCHAEDGCRGADGEWDPNAQHIWYIDEAYCDVERWTSLHEDSGRYEEWRL